MFFVIVSGRIVHSHLCTEVQPYSTTWCRAQYADHLLFDNILHTNFINGYIVPQGNALRVLELQVFNAVSRMYLCYMGNLLGGGLTLKTNRL